MADLEFDLHALREMARDHIPIAAIYHVVEDADEVVERDDGITEYIGTWGGMTIAVIAAGKLVITAWERKRDRPRHRRRRRR